ncbi:MAG TPA: NAD(P)-dependent oxidoreductase [Burkholderiales bacterium]|nr:NAD(P)-dependent oxidoreductase [Burkholderiales bacterium]
MAISKDSTQIGFIGTGIMGGHMARHLQAAGFKLHVYNRTKAKTDALVAGGATWHESPGAVAAESDVVISMVGFPKDVEETYLGAGGIVERAKKGAILIDMTTSSPALAKRIAEAAAKKGVSSLDAPVSGGDVGARDAKLSIMVGGDKAAFDAALPVFQLMGANIMLLGGPGAGQHTKMCNQIIIASTLTGVAEGISYAKRTGLDPVEVLKCIGGGAAASFQLNVLGNRMLEGNFEPGFFMEHFIKDLTIATEEAASFDTKLDSLQLAKSKLEALAKKGYGRKGTQALYKHYNPD